MLTHDEWQKLRDMINAWPDDGDRVAMHRAVNRHVGGDVGGDLAARLAFADTEEGREKARDCIDPTRRLRLLKMRISELEDIETCPTCALIAQGKTPGCIRHRTDRR